MARAVSRLAQRRLALVGGLSLAACTSSDDPCAPADVATARLGEYVAGSFEEFEDGQTLSTTTAPQGGFGVPVVVSTRGFEASSESKVDLLLVAQLDTESVGEFMLPNAAVLCGDDGGVIAGVVVGFDPDRFGDTEELLALDEQQVVLDVTVTDAQGREANVRTPVVVSVP